MSSNPTLLVVSDLHASQFKEADPGPSLINVDAKGAALGDAMFEKLVETVTSEGADVDWIICPGDMGDKANASGQRYVWERLEAVRSSLSAKYLIGTAGNHDLDSRLLTADFDPKENLQALQPSFPGITQADCDQYWARHFCIYKDNNIRILNVNSAAYHGFEGKSGHPEYEHGRISNRTINQICEEINNEDFAYNVLLTHHHILKNDHIYDNDNSEMNGSGRLLESITKHTRQPWFVIHGHQHYPELDYGRGSAHAPIIVSAGSFSANMPGHLASASPNQFYLVELENHSGLDGWQPCGQIKAWYWSPEGFWDRSPTSHRIPYRAGFGCRMNPFQSSKKVKDYLDSSSEPYVTLGEVLATEPSLKFLLPRDLDLMFWQLDKDGVKVESALDVLQTTLRWKSGK